MRMSVRFPVTYLMHKHMFVVRCSRRHTMQTSVPYMIFEKVAL